MLGASVHSLMVTPAPRRVAMRGMKPFSTWGDIKDMTKKVSKMSKKGAELAMDVTKKASEQVRDKAPGLMEKAGDGAAKGMHMARGAIKNSGVMESTSAAMARARAQAPIVVDKVRAEATDGAKTGVHEGQKAWNKAAKGLPDQEQAKEAVKQTLDTSRGITAKYARWAVGIGLAGCFMFGVGNAVPGAVVQYLRGK